MSGEPTATFGSLPVEVLEQLFYQVPAAEDISSLALTSKACHEALGHINEEGWKRICIGLGVVHAQDNFEHVLVGRTWRQLYVAMNRRFGTLLKLVIAGDFGALRKVCKDVASLCSPLWHQAVLPGIGHMMPTAIISAAMAIDNPHHKLQVLREVLKYRAATGPAALNVLGEALVEYAGPEATERLSLSTAGEDENTASSLQVHTFREIAMHLKKCGERISSAHYLAARQAATNLPDESEWRVHILRDLNGGPRSLYALIDA